MPALSPASATVLLAAGALLLSSSVVLAFVVARTGGSVAAAAANSVPGTLWVAKDGNQLVQISVTTQQPGGKTADLTLEVHELEKRNGKKKVIL